MRVKKAIIPAARLGSYEVGEKMGFIETTIDLALKWEDLRYGLLNYLSSVVDRELANEGGRHG